MQQIPTVIPTTHDVTKINADKIGVGVSEGY